MLEKQYMEETRQKIKELIDNCDNPQILENLAKLTEDYIKYYSVKEN